ncbi:hypothetical protein HOT49_gp264 [Erwinia phage vB_EamM_Alexandra]|uniref:Uncharacterized protein n=1 Tax=Erwinia phage vB_EamM_Alexandra TaxID=2201424 RepID=A0A2Z4QEW6_9CAUD|nr:hypothetical protein HOT49_gp264 [Erwinia phage vB_EamM_Alexandra]AWY08523.1 hypothetical protein Alexandra_266 [Erwinia phage vB_EamM_Alexandra]
MGDLNGNYWRYDIDKRAGNLTLPHLPKEFTATIKDNLTLMHTPVKIDGTTIVTSQGKTCGSLQFLTGANILIWSSFESYRFTLIVDEVTRIRLKATDRQSAELCK